MGLFGSLYLGVSGLQSGQEALNVVAHNVTNTDTKGYTRQQVSQGTREYNFLSKNNAGVSMKQTGLGVYISEVRQVRDRFVDASYRNQAGRQSWTVPPLKKLWKICGMRFPSWQRNPAAK